MVDRISRRASLAGQVVEDLTFEPLARDRFTAELIGREARPQYKDGGLFVFSDLPPGPHVLRLSGERLQPQSFELAIPFAPLLLDRPGDNELVVVAAAVETVRRGNADESRIAFDPVVLPRRIRAGARVLAAGFESRLAADLEAGTVVTARLESVAGLGPGALVRIVRDRSIRLKLDPWAAVPPGLVRITGLVTLAGGRPLPGTAVRLRRLGGGDVTVEDVAGAALARVRLGGRDIALGSATDVTSHADAQGRYHLYFPDALFPAEVTLEASREGHAAASRTVDVQRGERKIVELQLQQQT